MRLRLAASLTLWTLAGCGDSASEVNPGTMTGPSTSTTSDGGSSGETTDDASSTAVGSSGSSPSECGNGVVEADEACDDVNNDPLDGCLSNCTTGPGGLRLVEGTALEYQGGGGGVRYDDACPPNHVVVGFRGQADTTVRRLQGVCGRIEVAEEADGSALTLSVVASDPLPERGTDEAPTFDLPCPSDHAVVGFAGSSGAKLDALTLWCAPVAASFLEGQHAIEVDSAAAVERGPVGAPGAGTFGPSRCGPQEVVTAANIRAGGDINGLGLSCSALSFAQ